tara:strand:+ start:390 stop:1013 length:624 start_codon:yes stop_codon:yes gene_type:complete
MKKPIKNFMNKEVGSIDIDMNIFGIKTFPDIIHQYIRYQNAKSRQGTHKTKTRSEVNGKAKKPFSQKGTGNARQGSSKPPNFRGGATVKGPVNRDYSFNLNKKEKKLAIKSALSTKLSEDKIIFLDEFKCDNFKTKNLYTQLKNFIYDSALFIHSEKGIDKNFRLASSNLPKVSIISQKGLNVRDLFTYEKIFIEKQSLEEINKRFS